MKKKITASEILNKADKDLLKEIIKDRMFSMKFDYCSGCNKVIRRILDFNDDLEKTRVSIDTIALFFEHYEYFMPYDGLFDAKLKQLFCPACLFKTFEAGHIAKVQKFLANQCYLCAQESDYEYVSKKLPKGTLAHCAQFNTACSQLASDYINSKAEHCGHYKSRP